MCNLVKLLFRFKATIVVFVAKWLKGPKIDRENKTDLKILYNYRIVGFSHEQL